MSSTPLVSPAQAWQPLPSAAWTPEAARHLLRRAGWAATPAAAAEAHARGLPATLDLLFPRTTPAFAAPASIDAFRAEVGEVMRQARDTDSPQVRQELRQQVRDHSRRAEADLALAWLQTAVDPRRAAFEKWLFFLSDVYVVASEKVKRADLIWTHHDILRHHALDTGPALSKAVSRSPAMVIYLDLQENKAAAPNENFARELFELFVLGEGNYTEEDIKQTARAFTGYRQVNGEFRFLRPQHDAGTKTVFGQTGKFDGDAVIDLAYRQPAAATFLPRELLRFYLSEAPVEETYVASLGDAWRKSGFDLRALALRFFGSQLFYDPVFRGNRIKSPLEFYLGLLVDLDLDVAPLPRTVIGSLRLMGQELYRPPNVRGWVGGRRWINASTLGARRQMVQFLLTPLDDSRLNADEIAALDKARAAGREKFTIDVPRLTQMALMSDAEIATRFSDYFLPTPPNPAVRDTLTAHLTAAENPRDRVRRIRDGAVALLQSPAYQLC